MASKCPKPEHEIKNFTAAQLRRKANQFLKSKKHAKVLTEILDMFNFKCRSYTTVLLTVEMLFTQLLRRKDMYEVVVPMKPPVTPSMTPEAIYMRWLRDAYEMAMTSTIACMRYGDPESRVQALVTACKLLREEGINPMESYQGIISFPHIRLKNIFTALLDSKALTTNLIERFQEYTEYRDIQQYGLKMLSLLAYCKSPTRVFIHNYLALFDALMSTGLPKTPRPFQYQRHKEDRYYCEKDGKVPFVFNPEMCRRYINRCWGFACKWPLRATETTHRRALVVLVDRIMPYLARPQLATDLLCDSLDCGPVISTVALRGMLELVTRYKINYPDIYDRLYAMFEPEIFATRYKRRLLRLANVFLSSTHISESLVAAFAKRLSRLALVASPEDARAILALIASLVSRHPGLKRMLCHTQPAVMPKDPYLMDEACANSSRATQSSLWEVSALKLHFTPEVSASASRVLAVAEGTATLEPPPRDGQEQFEMEVRKRFKSIEVNFVQYPGLSHLSPCEQLAHHWNMEL